MLGRIVNRFYISVYRLISKLVSHSGIVYMMHSVGLDNPPKNCLNLTMERFYYFVDIIKKKNVISLENWESSRNFVALTFDDVWESFYQNAYPILQKNGIPFTLFVSIELLDKPNYITTEQLLRLSKDPLCTIGSHGMHHTYFSKLTKQQLESEFVESKNHLEKLINKEVKLFAFPYGSFFASGLTNKSIVLRYYKYAFSTIPTPISKGLFKKYFLPRINCC